MSLVSYFLRYFSSKHSSSHLYNSFAVHYSINSLLQKSFFSKFCNFLTFPYCLSNFFTNFIKFLRFSNFFQVFAYSIYSFHLTKYLSLSYQYFNIFSTSYFSLFSVIDQLLRLLRYLLPDSGQNSNHLQIYFYICIYLHTDQFFQFYLIVTYYLESWLSYLLDTVFITSSQLFSTLLFAQPQFQLQTQYLRPSRYSVILQSGNQLRLLQQTMAQHIS